MSELLELAANRWLLLFAGYLFCAVVMFAAWLCYLYNKNPTNVDFAWPLAIMASSVMYFSTNLNELTMLYLMLVTIWGLRLSFYIFYTRIKKGIKDKRYQELSRESENKNWFFLFNFQLQALLASLISFTSWVLVSSQFTEPAWYDIFMAMAAIFAIILESLADEQLRTFAMNFPGKICNIGLWHYSRHPNYFYDWLFWTIICVATFTKTLNPLCFISSMTLFFIMNKITIPITEEGSIKSKGNDYLEYQKMVSKFFPYSK